MKKLYLPALLLLLLPAFLIAQNARFNVDPQYPQKAQTIKITYNPASTDLEGALDILTLVYWLDNKSVYVHEVPMKKEGNVFVGAYTLDKTALALSFTFTSGDLLDNNLGKGYVTGVYDDKKELVTNGNNALGRLYGGIELNFVGLTYSGEKANPYFIKEFNQHPENKVQNFVYYFGALRNAKVPGLTDTIIAEGEKIEATGNFSDKNFHDLLYWYKEAKHTEKANALLGKWKEKFPNGTWKSGDALKAILEEKSGAKREAMMHAFVKEFPDDHRYVKWLAASAYAEEKNWEKFKELFKNEDVCNFAHTYFKLAWDLARNDENLELAKELSQQAAECAKRNFENPTMQKPDFYSTKQWFDLRKADYIAYADSYAYILYKLKDYKTGYAFIKDAIDLSGRKDPRFNDRYALLLEQVAPAAQIRNELEQMVVEGVAGPETRAVLQRTFTKEHKPGEGFTEYMTKLDESNLVKLKEKVKQGMVSWEAPNFRLRNLQEAEVDLAALRGKVVIIDFWATWCGPCVASFPKMQKAVDKYKDNKNVVFLFINTFENNPESVKKLIAKGGYTFNVLYDQQIDGSTDYAVAKNYQVDGLPTKIIIDGKGKIRFSGASFGRTEDAIMKELDFMIEMALAAK